MPYPGNNPNGSNGTEGPDTAYGAIKRATEQTSAAPMPGNPALAAPRRAQRAAQRPTGTPQPQPPPHPIEAQPMTYGVQIAQVWAELAAQPGASTLVQAIAQQAAQSG